LSPCHLQYWYIDQQPAAETTAHRVYRIQVTANCKRHPSVLFREPVLGLPDTRIFGGLLSPEYSGCLIGMSGGSKAVAVSEVV
jgi:hypothetical protein